MPEFPSDTRDELVIRARALIRGLVRGADVSNGSDYDIKARVLAAVAYGLQTQAETIVRLLDPRKAFGVFLREYADVQGVGGNLLETTIAAQKASGKAIIVSSTSGQTQTSGSVLTHADGTQYTLTANATTASAGATVYCGHRSGRKRIFQGHTGGGFASPTLGDVYTFTPTGEYAAVLGIATGTPSQQCLIDLYNDLDADPAIHDTLVQVNGAVASIQASVAGLAGNKDAKDTLTIASPVGTIQATAYILYLRGGRDQLSTGQIQAAIRDLQATRLGAMTVGEIRDIVLEYPHISLRDAFVFPGKNGIGTYEIMPLASDKTFVNAADRADIRTHAMANMSPADDVLVTQVVEQADNLTTLEVRVAPNMGPDWNLASGGTAALVVGVGSTTTRVVLASTTGIEVNDRVIVSCARATAPYCTYLVQRRVTAVAAGYVDVDSALPYPPVATTSFVTPGGPLAQAIIDAIYAHYDAQSPSGLNASPSIQYVRYPAPQATESIQGLYARVAAVEGVLDTYGHYSGVPSLAYNEVLTPGAIQIKMWA